jgi:cyclase
VQAKKIKNEWYAFSENARNNSEFIVTEWIKKCENFGVGEILLTSVDNEGCEIGFDVDLYNKVKRITNLPIIAHGGYGCNNDIIKLKKLELSAIAIGRGLHFKKITCNKIKEELKSKGFNFRN